MCACMYHAKPVMQSLVQSKTVHDKENQSEAMGNIILFAVFVLVGMHEINIFKS